MVTPDYKEANGRLFESVQNLSEEVLQTEMKLDDLHFTPETRHSAVRKGHFDKTCCISLENEDLKIIFRTHFVIGEMVDAVRKLHPDSGNIIEKNAIDFASELCNIIAGRIKLQLIEIECTLNQALPDSLDGFAAEASDDFTMFWALGAYEQLNLCISTSVEYLNPGIAEEITSYLKTKPLKSPDFEFF